MNSIAVIIAFVLGAIPFGYLLGRFKFGTDIRSHGSKNIGATNVARTFGMKAGAAVLLFDAVKGWAAVEVAYALHVPFELCGWIGIAAVLGHVFSPFLRFRGGKGVATGLGAVIALNLPVAVLALFVALVTVTILRVVSLASLGGVSAVAVGLFSFHHLDLFYSFGLPAFLIVIWTHRKNWDRLIKGTEPRMGEKKPQN